VQESATSMTSEEFVAEAKRLRANADRAEAEFLEFLYRGEQNAAMWQGAGYATFEQFIEAANLCRASRYVAYRKMRTHHGEIVTRVGVNASVAAASLPSIEEQAEVISQAQICEKVNGTSISEQTARQIARDVRTREAAHRSGHRSYSALLAENNRLRAENEALKERCKTLSEQLRGARTAGKARKSASA
jgi:hypothetical protein